MHLLACIIYRRTLGIPLPQHATPIEEKNCILAMVVKVGDMLHVTHYTFRGRNRSRC